MTTFPDWLLNAYARSGLPEFEAFAARARLQAPPQVVPPVPAPVPLRTVAAPTVVPPQVSQISPPPVSERRAQDSGAAVLDSERASVPRVAGGGAEPPSSLTSGTVAEFYDAGTCGEDGQGFSLTRQSSANGWLDWPAEVRLYTAKKVLHLQLAFDAPALQAVSSEALEGRARLLSSYALRLCNENQALRPPHFRSLRSAVAERHGSRLCLTFTYAGILPADLEVQERLLLLATVVTIGAGAERELIRLLGAEKARPAEQVVSASGQATMPVTPQPGPSARTAGSGEEMLHPAFLREAGLTRLDVSSDAFTEVVWEVGGESRGMGLLWLNPDEDRPYPLLAVRVGTALPGDEVTGMVAAAIQDHFMRLSMPVEVSDQHGHTWVLGRTLTPPLYVGEGEDGEAQIAAISVWPLVGRLTPALLRTMLAVTFGQLQDLGQRAGLPVEPDFTPPGKTGPGDRSWLSTEELQRLVGNQWTWEESRTNEIRCVVRGQVEDHRLGTPPRPPREVTSSFYLRYVDEEQGSVPTLYLRAHTNGSLARDRLGPLAEHHLQHLDPLIRGVLLPVTVDGDGDLTVRQIVLCPERPTPQTVQHLIQVAEQSLHYAVHEVVL